MNSERLVRLMAGSLILISLLLAYYVSHYWLWLAAFVGANLFQSALTRWCLAEKIFIALGARSCGALSREKPTGGAAV
jgi:hypothetical protein